MAVLDQSQDARSRALVQALVNSQYFDLTREAQSQDEVQRLIEQGQVKVGVVISARFAAGRQGLSAV